MNYEQIQHLIKVHIIVEEGHELFHDGLGPGATFWVHTHGMERFKRPDLEFVGVPAQWINESARQLNIWAPYSVDNAIVAGANLSFDASDAMIPVLMTATKTKADHWDGPLQIFGALTLKPLRVGIYCECCGDTSANALH